MKRKDRKRKAFTLLELICVIAIIVLLVGLLVPSLSRCKSMAVRTICSSNLRQYGILGAEYLSNYNDRYPDPQQWLYSAAADSPEHPIGCRWHDLAMTPNGKTMAENKAFQGQMWELQAESKVSICPDFRDIAYKRGCENPGHIQSIDVIPQYNYTMNGYLGSSREGGVLTFSHIKKIKTSFLMEKKATITFEKSRPTSPAKVFFFAEENCWSVRPDNSDYPARWLKNPLSTKALDDTSLLILPTPQAENCFATFHGDSNYDDSEGFANAVFVDGHVDMITVQQQLRQKMHAENYEESSGYGRLGFKQYNPAGNLIYAWASDSSPPGGWDGQ